MKNKFIATLLICLLVVTQFSVAFADEPNYGADEMVNLSINEPATASSELSDDNSAEKANDGVNDNPSYTYWKSADGDESPWWQVDMALGFEVSKIELEARKGEVDASERSNIRITGALKEDFSDSIVLYEGADDFGEVLTVEVSPAKKVRYIKVDKTAEGPLSIAEFKVWVKKASILQGAQSINPNYIPQSTVISQVEGAPTDILGTEYEKAVNLLAALDIMSGYPDGTFRPDDTITRAEFSKVASKLLAYATAPGEPTFTDVPKSHWAYEYVETAAAANVVNGTAKGVFSPEETITTQQTAKMLVSILGYREIAELEGGYPGGYMQMANKIKLFEDTYITSTNITRGQIALLVANALDIEVLNPKSYGDRVSATTYKGETLLFKNLGIVKTNGVVTAVKGTSLTNANIEYDENYIEINGKAFKCNLNTTSNLLGMRVDYYYYDAKAEPYEIVVIIDNDYNKVLEVSSENLVNVKEGAVTYFDGNKDRNFKLSEDLDVVFNGYALRAYDWQDLKVTDGGIKLIDNDSDSYADVLIANQVVTGVVSRVSADKMVIGLENGISPYDFNEKDDIVTVINADTGKIIDFANIAKGNVLTVTESVNTTGIKRYVVYVSTNNFEGTLTSIGEDILILDSTEYDIAPCFNMADVTVGCTGTFYIDMYGRVAFYDGTASSGKYGILKGAGVTKGMDGTLQLKIFTDAGAFETYDVHKTKFKLDGVLASGMRNEDPRDPENPVIKVLKTTGLVAGEIPQPVKYKLNGDNKVIYLDTIGSGVETEAGLTLNYPTKSRYYKNTGVMTISPSETGYTASEYQFAVTSDTTLFKLPDDLSSEKEYEVISTASMQSDSSYTMSGYDVENKIVNLLLVTGNMSGDGVSSNRLFVVDKVMPALDENGDAAVNVYGMYKGESVVFSAHESCEQDLMQLKQGDVITLNATSGRQIKSYVKRFYASNMPTDAAAVSSTKSQHGDLHSDLCLIYGYVNTFKDGILTIKCENIPIEEDGTANALTYQDVVVSINASELYTTVYDSDEERVYAGDPSTIIDAESAGVSAATKVMVRFSYRAEYDLVIFD